MLKYFSSFKITLKYSEYFNVPLCMFSYLSSFCFCQTPTPGKTWELTLLSRGNKNQKKKNNEKKKKNPHLNSPRRDCGKLKAAEL